MKRTYKLIAAIMLLSLPVRAQLVSTTTAILHDSTFSTGRDFWFAMQSNYWGEDLGGKYMRIYITSTEGCEAYVASGYTNGVAGSMTSVSVTAYEISSYKIPEFWEMESSGVAEDKAIHVWSNTADLVVYDLSHNPYTSDGSYIIPSIGWGTDYVVAAYGSLFEGFGNYVYDLPSTMMVVANQDNTTFEITPSCNLRQCSSGNANGDANSTIIVYPQGVQKTFTLQRGQCMEFMPIKAQDPDNFDLTGTIIHANKPVGVEGGSVCPNIPADFPYCDHVEDMIPPVRTWGETYYATNAIQPPGETNKNDARYLFIASKANQTIFHQNCTASIQTECIISTQYGIYWDELPGTQKFTSDAPFLVVQYLNSATYPDGVNGLGDPAEAIVMPREQYTKTVAFETPLSVGNIVPYDDYAEIIVNVKDKDKTLFDHKSMSGYGSQCLDSNWEVFSIPHIAPAVHTITGNDSGVGLWIFGYGFDESYAWSAPAQCKTFQSTDSISPIAAIATTCTQAFIRLTDTGALASKLDMIRLDSVFNMNFQVDADWIEGGYADTGGYSLSVVDLTKPARIVVSAYDYAGNRTTIVSSYTTQYLEMFPSLQSFGAVIAPDTSYAYDTLINVSTETDSVEQLRLLNGTVGFRIDSAVTTPLAPGERRIIKIAFSPLTKQIAEDTIVFANECSQQSAALVAGGGGPDFLVTDQTWPDELLTIPPTCYPKTVTIINFSTASITIDKAFWKDVLHFQAVTSFPITVPPSPGTAPFTINYCPDSSSLVAGDNTQGSWTSPQVLDGKTEVPHLDNLSGSAISPNESFSSDVFDSFYCADANDTATAYFALVATGTANSTITSITQTNPGAFFNLLGNIPGGAIWNPATTEQTLVPGEGASISVQCVIPFESDTTLVDSVMAFDVNHNLIGSPQTVTVRAVYIPGPSESQQLTFGPMLFKSPSAQNTNSFLIQNTTNAPIEINSIALAPGGTYNAAFTLTTTVGPSSFPYLLPVGVTLVESVDFNDSVSSDPVQTAIVEISSNTCNQIEDTLTGLLSTSGVTETVAPSLNAIIIPSEDERSLEIIFPSTIVAPVNFLLVNVLGESVLRNTLTARTQNVDASSLPRGVYFYRLTSGQMSQSGKVILGQ